MEDLLLIARMRSVRSHMARESLSRQVQILECSEGQVNLSIVEDKAVSQCLTEESSATHLSYAICTSVARVS